MRLARLFAPGSSVKAVRAEPVARKSSHPQLHPGGPELRVERPDFAQIISGRWRGGRR
jgi:hypothetical protein